MLSLAARRAATFARSSPSIARKSWKSSSSSSSSFSFRLMSASTPPGRLSADLAEASDFSSPDGPVLRQAKDAKGESSSTLIDAPLVLAASGLEPGQDVTLSLSLDCPGEKLAFRSHAHFRSSDQGEVRCDRDAAINGGSYKGVHPMGLFTRMRPRGGKEAVAEGKVLDVLMVRNTDIQLEFKLRAWRGHLGREEVEDPSSSSSSLLCELSVPRRYFFPSRVKRSKLKAGRVRGTMFVPTDGKDHPLVVTVYGGLFRGTAPEEKAAVLASYGYSTLALAFYGVDDLPKKYGDLEKVEVEYFEEALDAASELAGVDGGRVAMVGNSKGGDLVLSCAAFLGDRIRAAASLNSCIASVANKTTYKDRVVEPILFDSAAPDKIKIMDDGRLDPLGLLDDLYKNEKAIIPFPESTAALLIQAGEDDHNYESAHFAREAERMLRSSDKTNYRSVVYPGMGHLCQVPFSPGTFDSMHPLAPPGIRLYMGGDKDPDAHFSGQESAWRDLLRFLHSSLK